MKISIITATYNSSKTIIDCIKSVNEQTYDDIEHIIIDSASDDNTIELINSISNRVHKIISEPDGGIYDAMNKGINLTTGEVIAILNSDDFYANERIIETVVDKFKKQNCDCLFGNLDIVSSKNPRKVIRHWKGSPFIPGKFSFGWHPAHPTFFVKKEIYSRLGAFETSLNVSADFELMLRFLEKEKISNYFLDETLVKMRYGGESTSSLKNILEGNINIREAFRKNDLEYSKLYPFYRIISKLKQFIAFNND